MKKVFIFSIIASMIILGSGRAFSVENEDALSKGQSGSRPIPEQLQEISGQISRMVTEQVQQFLDKELLRIKEYRAQARETANQKLKSKEKSVEENPNNPQTLFELGELHDQMGDGASAILKTQKAEKLFVENGNVKGAAQARRNLRQFFKKYDYQPEDFILNNK